MTTKPKKAKSNHFFLISFLPAIAYWYLEANYPIKIALIGGISLAVLEIIVEKVFWGHIHQISKLNFFLIAGLGGFSLMEENGVWFKLQPTLSMWAMSLFMIYKLRKKEGFFKEMLDEFNDESEKIPIEVLKLIERNLCVLFIFYGMGMFYLALWGKTSHWVFFKTAGFFIVFFIFMVGQIIYLRKHFKT